MAELVTRNLSSKGSTPAYAAASAGGDSFKFDEELILHIRHQNAAGAAVTVTLESQVSDAPAGLVAQPVTVTVQPGEDGFVDMARAQNLRDSNGQVQVSYSAAADIEVAVLRKQG